MVSWYINPRWCADGRRIDCILNHPEFGPIPFTANPDDGEGHGKEIHAAILAGTIPIAPIPEGTRPIAPHVAPQPNVGKPPTRLA